jgi:hypothetical protein
MGLRQRLRGAVAEIEQTLDVGKRGVGVVIQYTSTDRNASF